MAAAGCSYRECLPALAPQQLHHLINRFLQRGRVGWRDALDFKVEVIPVSHHCRDSTATGRLPKPLVLLPAGGSRTTANPVRPAMAISFSKNLTGTPGRLLQRSLSTSSACLASTPAHRA